MEAERFMTRAIESLGIIHNNPFILAPLFLTFYKNISPRPQNQLLSYLVLPLVLYPASRHYLDRANSKSSIRVLMQKKDRVYGLAGRIQGYRSLTNTCLQYAIDTRAMRVNEDLTVGVIADILNHTYCPAQSDRAARKLAALCAPYEVPTIFRMLGLKKL